jgi:hypothetical protein
MMILTSAFIYFCNTDFLLFPSLLAYGLRIMKENGARGGIIRQSPNLMEGTEKVPS